MKKSVHYISFFLFGSAIFVSCSDEKMGENIDLSVEKVDKIERVDLPAKTDSVEVIPEKPVSRPTPIPPVDPIEPYPIPEPWPDPDPRPDPWRDRYPDPPAPVPYLNEPVEELTEFPDVEAQFPGGADSLLTFIRENILYPEVAKEMGEQGRVFVQCVVEKDGSLSNITIVRGVSPSLDQEAKRVVKLMPKWKPAESNGKIVRSRKIVPVLFRLD